MDAEFVHDLNNIIARLSGLCRSLEFGLKVLKTEEQDKLNEVVQKTKRISEVIFELSDYVKTNSKR